MRVLASGQRSIAVWLLGLLLVGCLAQPSPPTQTPTPPSPTATVAATASPTPPPTATTVSTPTLTPTMLSATPTTTPLPPTETASPVPASSTPRPSPTRPPPTVTPTPRPPATATAVQSATVVSAATTPVIPSEPPPVAGSPTPASSPSGTVAASTPTTSTPAPEPATPEAPTTTLTPPTTPQPVTPSPSPGPGDRGATATATAQPTVTLTAIATAEPSTPTPTPTPEATPTPVPPLSGRIDVALDPGHSRADPGASGGGQVEYKLTLILARKVRDRLAAQGLAVVLTRTNDEPLTAYRHPDETTRIRLEQEARIAAGAGARIYVSIHFDASTDPRVAGNTVYYNSANFGPTSRQLGQAIQRETISRVQAATGYALRARGVLDDLTIGKPYGHLFSLRGPFPSVLIEGMFLSNPTEAGLLGHEETLDALANGYAEGIRQYLRETGQIAR